MRVLFIGGRVWYVFLMCCCCLMGLWGVRLLLWWLMVCFEDLLSWFGFWSGFSLGWSGW